MTKFLPLLFSNFRRKRLRTLFTLLSIGVAFVLFAYLAAIRSAFAFGIEIAGQDLGGGVESVCGAGNTECEWWWSVAPGDVAAALAALGGAPGEGALEVLARWSAANPGRDPGQRIRDAGVPVGFFSRVGD